MSPIKLERDGIDGAKCPVSYATRKSQKYWITISTKPQLDPQLHNILWGMLGDKKMWAKPDEHNRNEDAEMDTRKHKERPHQKCYHPGKGAYKTNKHFSDEETTVMVWSCAAERRGQHCKVCSKYSNRRILPQRRPKLRWMDRLKDDMKKNNIRPERKKVHCITFVSCTGVTDGWCLRWCAVKFVFTVMQVASKSWITFNNLVFIDLSVIFSDFSSRYF